MPASQECPISTGHPARPCPTWWSSSSGLTAASRSITAPATRTSSSTCWVGTANSRSGDAHHRPVNRANWPTPSPLLWHGDWSTPPAGRVRHGCRYVLRVAADRAASVGRQFEYADPDQPGPCQQRRARPPHLERLPVGGRDPERATHGATGLHLAHQRRATRPGVWHRLDPVVRRERRLHLQRHRRRLHEHSLYE